MNPVLYSPGPDKQRSSAPGTEDRVVPVLVGCFVAAEHDVFGVGVVLERVGGHVFAEAGGFVAAVGHFGDDRDVVVDPDAAGLDFGAGA